MSDFSPAHAARQTEDSFRCVVGCGIDTVVGGEGTDHVIICGEEGRPTAFLVEEATTYNARTGSHMAAGQVLVSAGGALIMCISSVERITINAGDAGDTLTVAGDFTDTLLEGGLPVFNPVGNRTSEPAAPVVMKTAPKPAARHFDDGANLLVFRSGGERHVRDGHRADAMKLDQAGGSDQPEDRTVVLDTGS